MEFYQKLSSMFNSNMANFFNALFPNVPFLRILTMGVQISFYIYLHTHYRLIDLPWDNPSTWYLTLLGVDFAYYWAHRASHEVNFLWAQHQIHHSSEDYNMAVAVRHPITHNWINSVS